jgi:hypothetical protein
MPSSLIHAARSTQLSPEHRLSVPHACCLSGLPKLLPGGSVGLTLRQVQATVATRLGCCSLGAKGKRLPGEVYRYVSNLAGCRWPGPVPAWPQPERQTAVCLGSQALWLATGGRPVAANAWRRNMTRVAGMAGQGSLHGWTWPAAWPDGARCMAGRGSLHARTGLAAWPDRARCMAGQDLELLPHMKPDISLQGHQSGPTNAPAVLVQYAKDRKAAALAALWGCPGPGGVVYCRHQVQLQRAVLACSPHHPPRWPASK